MSGIKSVAFDPVPVTIPLSRTNQPGTSIAMPELTNFSVETLVVPANEYVPNHTRYPFLIYRGVWADKPAPQEALSQFASNGWGGGWINGVFPFHHYHAESHEVLANTGPTIQVQFGGPEGEIVEFKTGDIVLIPAGGGHCLMPGSRASGIVGAYPAGQEDWDLKRNDPKDYQLALQQIPVVPLPMTDPVTGNQFPLLDYWK